MLKKTKRRKTWVKLCGIYKIVCVVTGKVYVGSSNHIYKRWSEHLRNLNKGRHHAPFLQHAWNKYGENNFVLEILEQCDVADLETREQWHLDALQAEFNSVTDVKRHQGPTIRAKITASLRIRAAAITHCPRGHEYTAENTFLNQGKRVCRVCNALRVADIYANETPEQREHRRVVVKANQEANKETRRAYHKFYTERNKKHKQEYDKTHREQARANRQKRIQSETFEQREHRLQMQRIRYQRWSDKQAELR